MRRVLRSLHAEEIVNVEKHNEMILDLERLAMLAQKRAAARSCVILSVDQTRRPTRPGGEEKMINGAVAATDCAQPNRTGNGTMAGKVRLAMSCILHIGNLRNDKPETISAMMLVASCAAAEPMTARTIGNLT